MSAGAEIRDSIQKLAGSGFKKLIVCRVDQLNEEDQTVDVSPVNGDAEIFAVRLQPKNEAEGVLVYPKEGSHVLVGMVSNTLGYVLTGDKTKAIALKANGSDLYTEVNKLFDLVDNLIGIMKQFQLATNVGPTIKVMPHITVKLQVEKNNLNAVKNSINKILKPF